MRVPKLKNYKRLEAVVNSTFICDGLIYEIIYNGVPILDMMQEDDGEVAHFQLPFLVLSILLWKTLDFWVLKRLHLFLPFSTVFPPNKSLEEMEIIIAR